MSKFKASKALRRIKPKVQVNIKRNGEVIWSFKRKRDLLVWRGQSVIAYLLSQGNVGTSTSQWKVVASENSTMPDMSDDSGNPEQNEFYPLIGSPANVTFIFEPTVKPSGAFQTYATITIKGTVVSDGNKTLRKIGIIDSNPTPNRNIIIEDMVIPRNVQTNDEIEIIYTVQLG